jgi:exosortase
LVVAKPTIAREAREVSVPALALGGAVLVAILVLTYREIFADLVRQWWDDPNYSHGFLVPVFSAYLVWERRSELAALPREGTWWGLPVLVLGVAALILGDVGAENFLTRSSLIVILAGLALLHLGMPIARVLAFPLAYLFFMVPLPAMVFYAIAFPLQGLAAENAAWTLDLLGVPVLLDGNVIRLSQITLGVTEACSGIRSLISLLALAVAWAYLMVPGVLGGALLVASAVPITVLANAGRVVATGLIGQTLGVQYATGFFHSFSGWVIFIFAFAGLLAVHGVIVAGRRWVVGRRGRRPGSGGATG